MAGFRLKFIVPHTVHLSNFLLHSLIICQSRIKSVIEFYKNRKKLLNICSEVICVSNLTCHAKKSCTCFLRQKVHKNLFQKDVLAQSTAIRLVSLDKQEDMAQFPAIKIICKIARVLKQIYRCMPRKSRFLCNIDIEFRGVGAMS